MGNLIFIAIYLLIMILIGWLLIKIMPFFLGIAGIAGLAVGIFYGIKGYISSIDENINSRAFKIIMKVITFVFVLVFFGAILYFVSSADIFKRG